ncbi:MAG: UDP-N-acetylglucosamine--N-acetylmuramyl-(pentapeptide) pyrophosphoryl-undecaprenol N-acetylglucosamine transferase [Bacteriovoracaceae bacterium]|nr:UDP-N-acetylglucosamine--N-acetylmuramyl-(pentapeptide) pyrophosphoryl-undecaprenol N-acetylglucosamine transferase [Bacteriovoracaceae bacterium]
MIKRIIFSGGGSGGHVMPALTLIEELKNKGYEIEYIGGNGIESEIVPGKEIKYHLIHTGKLRRYFSFQNMIDLFKVGLGVIEAFFILLRKSPMNTLVFSTGGFVSVPVVVAAWLTGKKIFIHEQTSRVGLANKIASKFADKIFISFEESFNYFPKNKTVYSGYPVRDSCHSDSIGKVLIDGKEVNNSDRPILFITGGGNGAKLLNEKIKENLAELSQKYLVIHQVGKQFIDEYEKLKSDYYIPVKFVGEEMIDLFKLSSVVLSRAGAGTVSELISLNKRSIFIPLKIAQKNEQYHNAMEAQKKIGSMVVEEEEFSSLKLSTLLDSFLSNKIEIKETKVSDGKKIIIEEVEKLFS